MTTHRLGQISAGGVDARVQDIASICVLPDLQVLGQYPHFPGMYAPLPLPSLSTAHQGLS